METIGRRDLLMLLIGLSEDGRPTASVSGITRLQKFLYLLEREAGIVPTGDGFAFEPYKAGPYSSKLYDDLELLENLRLLEAEATAESTDTETADLSRLTYEDLVGGFDQLEQPNDEDRAFEERRFSLTQKGLRRVEDLLKAGTLEPVVDGIRTIKSKYGHYSLSDLLYCVYSKYPEMTSESEILDKVLKRRTH